MVAPLKVWHEAEGRLLRLRLNQPKANLIDGSMMAALHTAFAEHVNGTITAVLLDAAGPHFSFGASVEEHLPENCTNMLRSIHRLVLRMLNSTVPILVAVRGQCLGGGLEVAMAGHIMFVAPDAVLGQPEIKLGVFAPAASCLLPELISHSRAIELLLSGRGITGSDAVAIGLAHNVDADPERAAVSYFEEYLNTKSASSLNFAIRAARFDFCERMKAKIETVERIYLEELMATDDAIEGLDAFIKKRPAQWSHR